MIVKPSEDDLLFDGGYWKNEMCKGNFKENMEWVLKSDINQKARPRKVHMF